MGTEDFVTKRASIILFTFHKDLRKKRHYNGGNLQDGSCRLCNHGNGLSAILRRSVAKKYREKKMSLPHGDGRIL